MRFKSLRQTPATNQSGIKATCVANKHIFLLCLLLSTEVCWSYANIKHHRPVRQLNTETSEGPINYDDTTLTDSYYQPHFTGNRTVVVQLFEWKFMDVAQECRDFLGPQGYAGVQLSPVLEHTVIETEQLKHPWWERYEVVSYRLASRSGDESEFWSMSRICNEAGVRIYVDVVLNHMAAPLHFMGVNENEADNGKDFIVNTLLETNVDISQLNYPNVSFTARDFHSPSCVVMANTQDAHKVRNCQLNGHPDLDHSRANVQKRIVGMLNKFVDMGVAGFRIDAARYIWPIDLKNIFKQVKNLKTEFNFKKNSRPFVYHDVFDLGLDTISKTEYTTYGVVSEYLYPVELATILNGKVALSSLINWGPAMGFLPHEDSLVFIDSHDTQRGFPRELGNNRVLTHKQRMKYIMANVFMLVHPYGAIKRIMSSYYFSHKDINQGPPVEQADEQQIRSPEFNEQKQCTKQSGWVCEHRWPVLVNMLKVANYFKMPGNKEESIIYFQTNGPHQVAFCRGRKAFVAINNDPGRDFSKAVYACLEPGIYCDVVTGGKKKDKEKCYGKMLEINENGYMQLQLTVADDPANDYEWEDEANGQEEESGKIESYGIIVIYIETKIKPTNENSEDEEEFKGQEEKAAETETNNESENDNVNNSNTETKSDENETKVNEEEENNNNNADDSKEEERNANDNQENTNKEQETTLEEKEPEAVDSPGKETSANQEGETEDEDSPTNIEPAENDEQETTLEEKDPEAVDSPDKETSANQEGETEDADLPTNKEAENEEQKAVEAENASKEIKEENSNSEKNTEIEETLENKEENNIEQTEEQQKQLEPTENADNEEGAQEISAEIQEEKPIEDHKAEEEAAGQNGLATEQNQSRNLEETNTEAEAQIEKPSAEIIKDGNKAVDTVTAREKDIQTAGIFSKPKGNVGDG